MMTGIRAVRTRQQESRGITGTWLIVPALLAICAGYASAQRITQSSQPAILMRLPAAPVSLPVALPFAVGEVLNYEVRAGNLATGNGKMWIEAPQMLRGAPALVLRSDLRAGVGPLGGSGKTESWLDAQRMASLRFVKDERRLLSRYRESVELFPAERRWIAADGREGASPSHAPLDELSFIYFVRTLILAPRAEYSFNRHFEAERNPVTVRVLGRESVTVPAGRFATILVEMRVKDPRNYQGEGIIRIHLTDDCCRLPVRIESTVPGVGRTVLALGSVVHPGHHCVEHGG